MRAGGEAIEAPRPVARFARADGRDEARRRAAGPGPLVAGHEGEVTTSAAGIDGAAAGPVDLLRL